MGGNLGLKHLQGQLCQLLRGEIVYMKILESYHAPDLQLLSCDLYTIALSFTGLSPEIGDAGSGNLGNIPDDDENQW